MLCYAIYGNQVFTVAMNAMDRTFTLLRQQQSLQSFITTQEIEDQYGVPRYQQPIRFSDPKLQFRDESLRRLLQRSLSDSGVVDLKAWSLPPGRIRFLVYMPLPDAFRMETNVEGDAAGDVLFIRDLPLNTEE